jgi:hypothetical protein
MSKRFYFLVNDFSRAKALIAELKELGLPDSHLGVVAHDSMPVEDLPEASLLKTSELGKGLELGLGVGGVAGLIGGILAVTFPPAGLILGGSAVLATTVAGAGFGALVSGLVSKDMPTPEVETLESGVASGRVLLLVDAPEKDREAILKRIEAFCPEADVSAVPAPSSMKAAVIDVRC